MKNAYVSRSWFTSSYTNGNGCVEVRFDNDTVFIRDTKYRRNPANDPALEPIIALPANKWKGFLKNVTDPTVAPVDGVPAIELHTDGTVTLRHGGIVLDYTEFEWSCFLGGIRDNEFELIPV